jgi:asparagine synthase (glutamine-hydrolysing)
VVPVARKLGHPLLLRFVSREETLKAVHEVVRILRIFNPMEVVNCTAVYVALSEAKLRGAGRSSPGFSRCWTLINRGLRPACSAPRRPP